MNRNLDFYYLWLSTLEDSAPACRHTFPIHDANWEKWDAHKHMFSLNYHYGDRVQPAFIGNNIYTLCVLMKPLGSEENFLTYSHVWSENQSKSCPFSAQCLLFWCFIVLFLWYISGVPGVRRVYIRRSASLLRARGNFERMQQWQMGRECADRDKTKTETQGRKGRRGGWKNRVRNKVFVSHCPLFSISVGQREQANMIFS